MNETERNPLTQKDPKPFHYKYARPIVAIDLCCIGISKEPVQEWKDSITGKPDDEKPQKRLVVFIQRKDEGDPWCLPGRFMHFASTPGDENENKSGEEWRDTLDRVRERSWNSYSIIAGKVRDESLGYKVPLNEDILYSVPPLDRKDRDHRHRIISLPRVTFVGNHMEPIRPELDHVARWVPIETVVSPKTDEQAYNLGYDHITIVKNALLQLRIEASTRPLGKGLVSDDNDFDLQELAEIYNVLFGKQFSKSNLKKQFEEKGLIQSNATSPLKKGQRRRGERFRFVNEVYDRYKDDPLKFTFLPRTKEE